MPDERLLRETNPPIGDKAGFLPQHKVEGTGAYEETLGSDGALHTKDKDVISRLLSLESKIDSIISGSTPAVTKIASDNVVQTKPDAIKDIVTGALTVTSAGVELKVGAAALTGRTQIIVYPPNAGTIYWGKSDVTAATGAPFSAGEQPLFFDVDASSPKIYLISDGTNRTVRVVESS